MQKKISNKKLLAEVAGWYGALAILTAYALVSFNVLESDGLVFQLLNLTGALGVLTISIYKKVGQTVALNVFWALVALIAVISILG